MDGTSENPQPRERPHNELFVTPEQYHGLLSSVSKMLDVAYLAGILPDPYEHTKIEPTDFYAPGEYLPILEQRTQELLEILRNQEKAIKPTTAVIQMQAVLRPIHELGLGPANVTGTKLRGEDIISATVGTKHTGIGNVLATTRIDLSTPPYFTDLMVSFEKKPERKSVFRIQKPFNTLTLTDSLIPIYLMELTNLGLRGQR